jgi:hypothetical protein
VSGPLSTEGFLKEFFCSMSSQTFLNFRTSIGHELPADCNRGRKGGTKGGVSAGKATYSPARGLTLTPCHLLERDFRHKFQCRTGSTGSQDRDGVVH